MRTGVLVSKYAFLEKITDVEMASHHILRLQDEIGYGALAKHWQERFDKDGQYFRFNENYKEEAEHFTSADAVDIEIWRWPGIMYVVGKLGG